MEVRWTRGALGDLEGLDHRVAERVVKRVSWLSRSFGRVVPEPLSGEFKGTFKLRVGDWRVVYTVEEDVIVIRTVAHRSEIYR